MAPSATFSQPVTPGTVSFTVTDSGGNAVESALRDVIDRALAL